MAYYRKSTKTTRPKSKYVLHFNNDALTDTNGSDDETEAETKEAYGPAVSFNIPALIRVLELVREDVVSDDMLHYLVEKLIEVGVDDVIDMDNYSEIASVIPIRLARGLR